MTQSRTERASYIFAVKEFGDDAPWIMLERSGKGLEVVGNGFIGLELTEFHPDHFVEVFVLLHR
jgi:hypothetical protein